MELPSKKVKQPKKTITYTSRKSRSTSLIILTLTMVLIKSRQNISRILKIFKSYCYATRLIISINLRLRVLRLRYIFGYNLPGKLGKRRKVKIWQKRKRMEHLHRVVLNRLQERTLFHPIPSVRFQFEG